MTSPKSMFTLEDLKVDNITDVNSFWNEFAELHTKYSITFFGSLARSYELVVLSNVLSYDLEYASNPSLQDIRRAAVVFAHATLEEFLRGLGGNLIFETKDVKAKLKEIPLATERKQLRAEKFTLSELVQFRGKSIDEVLLKSVLDYFQRSTYNNIEDIINLLNILDIPHSIVESSLPDIAKMIWRRHEIVHKADTFPNDDNSKMKEVSDIAVSDVSHWIYAIIVFIYGTLFSLTVTRLMSRGLLEAPPDIDLGEVKVRFKDGSLIE